MRFLVNQLQILAQQVMARLGSLFYPVLFDFSVVTSVTYSSAYFVYQVFEGTAGDNWETLDFPKIVKRVSVIPEDEMMIRLSYDGDTYGDMITIPAESASDIIEFDARCKGAMVKNATFGDSVGFQMIVFFLTSS